MDLAIFGDYDGDMFSTTNPIITNAQLFLNKLEDYDLIMVGAPLFTSEACQQIAHEYDIDNCN